MTPPTLKDFASSDNFGVVDPTVTPKLVAEHGLTPEEFERIKKILGREPNFTELGIFSVMWSEHY